MKVKIANKCDKNQPVNNIKAKRGRKKVDWPVKKVKVLKLKSESKTSAQNKKI